MTSRTRSARWRQLQNWCPYLVPYLAFALTVEIQKVVANRVAYQLYPLRVALPLICFLFYLARNRFPELAGFRPTAGQLLLDALVGLGIAALWSVPYILGVLPRPRTGFDPSALGESGRLLLLALRLIGFGVVTPFIEELFIRSFVLRLTAAWNTGRDFRDVPIGRFTWRSFLVSVAAFTVSHAEWQWPVAVPAGIAYNLWLYRRRHLGAVVLTHAVTNVSLFALVVGASVLSSPEERRGLWFLL